MKKRTRRTDETILQAQAKQVIYQMQWNRSKKAS